MKRLHGKKRQVVLGKTVAAALAFCAGAAWTPASASVSVSVSAGAALPNEYVSACLQSLSQECALRSALQTAIAEELGLEKATVLIGVAEALIDVGQDASALQTLSLALDETRDARLPLVTQEKIKSIAPLMARAGDFAGALALVEEIQIQSVQDQVLESLAAIAINDGDLASAQVALNQVGGQRRMFWRSLELYLKAPVSALKGLDLQAYEISINEQDRPDLKYRGLVTLALIERRRGDRELSDMYMAKAEALLANVISAQTLADMVSVKIQALYEVEGPGEVLDAAFAAIGRSLSGAGRQKMIVFANRVGPIEAATGRLDDALSRLDLMSELEARVSYVASLRPETPQAGLQTVARMLMAEIQPLESMFERDHLYLQLLEGVVATGDLVLAEELVRVVEDDDSQAIAIAKLAPLL